MNPSPPPPVPCEVDPAGEYETHLTVAAGDPHLDGWSAVRIELAAGAHPVQPMLTHRAREPFGITEATVAAAVVALRAAGFAVVRVKVEAAPTNAEVPATDAEATGDPPERYFEHHVKLLLPAGDFGPLADVIGRHAGRLSRNARRVRADGRAEWFVTQRCRRVGRETARRALDDLLAALHAAGYEVLEAEQEYVVRDTNLALDAGWLDPEDAP